jgi:hypothetical protein
MRIGWQLYHNRLRLDPRRGRRGGSGLVCGRRGRGGVLWTLFGDTDADEKLVRESDLPGPSSEIVL